MNAFYWGLALLVVWGDLVKSYYPAQEALAMLYAAACLLLLLLVGASGWRLRPIQGRDANLASNAALFLILIYFLQWGTSVYGPAREGLNHVLYMAIPLAYVVVISLYRPNFDHVALANLVLLLMIPVNLIGIVQYTVDPTFFISTSYSGESGGVIRRNLLYDAAFQRFPSLYASADRYSAMGLMQFYYSIILLNAPTTGRLRLAWTAFNVLGALTALAIAGARSRIMIVFVLAAVITVVYLVQRLLAGQRQKGGRILAILSAATVIGFLAFVAREAPVGQYSVFVFLQQSLLERDLNHRIDQTITQSRLPDEISAFGQGLGTIGVGGKPGEFGIRSIWAESGVIWGSLLLAGFTALMLALARRAIVSIRQRHLLELALSLMAILIVATALLTGLTSAFELSSGLLLACAIVLAVRPPAPDLKPG